MSAQLSSGIAGSLAVVIFSVFCLLAFVPPAHPHFLLNLNVRILHVEHLADGVRVFLRTPMPYLVADRVGPEEANGLPEPAPFTTNRMEEGKLVHYVDPAQFNDDPKGLGAFARDGFRLVAGGKRPEATVEQVRLHRVGSQPGFATLEEAKSVFAEKQAQLSAADPLYVGDTVVDVLLRYETGDPVYDYAISSTLNPGLPGQEDTANLILDYGPGGTKVFRARGLLSEPVTISRSTFAAVLTFIQEGVRHILEGLDHVLFVLCLVIGAANLRSLIWRATGFTIGHSVTLSLGFLGYVPSGAWFVPTVETGIALSIVYAAAIAVIAYDDERRTEVQVLTITTLIGLLHGLGFSFVLHKILSVDSPDIWQSLLAFNVGVEIGQVLIILVTWPLFRLVAYFSPRAWQFARVGVAAVCGGIATYWVFERAPTIIGA